MPLRSDVSLDTQVFYTNNFDFRRTAFKEIISKVELDRVRLFLTSITVREVKRQIRKKVRDASNAIGKLRKDLTILANSAVPDVSARSRRLDEKMVTAELTEQFERFIQQTRATVLDCYDVDPEVVFTKYFDVALPFEEREEKKREFPDAFAIEVLRSFAEEEKSSLAVVSGDKGFRGAAQDSGLSVFTTIEEFLDRENREWDAKVTEHVLKCYEQNTQSVRREIEDDFRMSAFVLTDVDGDVENPAITGLTIENPPLVVRIEKVSAILEVQVRVFFTADISYDDPDATVYDKEDGRTYVFNTINERIEETVEFSLEVTLNFDPLDDSYCNLSIGQLNEGRDFEVSSSY